MVQCLYLSRGGDDAVVVDDELSHLQLYSVHFKHSATVHPHHLTSQPHAPLLTGNGQPPTALDVNGAELNHCCQAAAVVAVGSANINEKITVNIEQSTLDIHDIRSCQMTR